MNPEKLEILGSLKFGEKIIVNGITLYRGNEPRDLNTQDNYWEYEFYKNWDKKKNLLPPTSHIIKVYVSFKREIENGKEIFRVNNYFKGILRDLQNNSEEEITEIRK